MLRTVTSHLSLGRAHPARDPALRRRRGRRLRPLRDPLGAARGRAPGRRRDQDGARWPHAPRARSRGPSGRRLPGHHHRSGRPAGHRGRRPRRVPPAQPLRRLRPPPGVRPGPVPAASRAPSCSTRSSPGSPATSPTCRARACRPTAPPTPCSSAGACAATSRTSSSRCCGPRTSPPASRPSTRPGSSRWTSTRSPRRTSTARGTWSTRPGWPRASRWSGSPRAATRPTPRSCPTTAASSRIRAMTVTAAVHARACRRRRRHGAGRAAVTALLDRQPDERAHRVRHGHRDRSAEHVAHDRPARLGVAEPRRHEAGERPARRRPRRTWPAPGRRPTAPARRAAGPSRRPGTHRTRRRPRATGWCTRRARATTSVGRTRPRRTADRSASRWLLTDTYSPAAIDSAPATSAAMPGEGDRADRRWPRRRHRARSRRPRRCRRWRRARRRAASSGCAASGAGLACVWKDGHTSTVGTRGGGLSSKQSLP